MSPRISARHLVLASLAAAYLLAAGLAAACPVCYGDSDSPFARGAELSILFMAIITYVMIVGGVVAFILLRRRARRLERHPEAA